MEACHNHLKSLLEVMMRGILVDCDRNFIKGSLSMFDHPVSGGVIEVVSLKIFTVANHSVA